MTKISAKIVADSKNEFGNRLTAMVVTFPRFILAELNTHRMMSKNSASSRAIPFEKMLESVQNNPFIPIAWQKDHKGMQGTEYLSNETGVHTHNWLAARDNAVASAKFMAANDVTKQLCNRLLEPFMWHTVLITASEFENFFALRCPRYEIFTVKDGENTSTIYRSKKDVLNNTTSFTDYSELDWLKLNKGQAEIHMMELAEQMWDAMNESTPKELKAGEWHIPFGDGIAYDDLNKLTVANNYSNLTSSQHADVHEQFTIKISTARCARVSYTVVGEENKAPNYENDLKLHDRLIASGHMSPAEHCGKAMNSSDQSGNFKGFTQYRKVIEEM